jgi:hypothetical protein
MIQNGIPAYDEIRTALTRANSLGDAIHQVSAIGAIRISKEWSTSSKRVLMLGQETGALDFSLEEMRDKPDGIEEVALSYDWFDFAENKAQRSSPFWRAHRRLAHELENDQYRAVMWSNLVKVQSALETGSGIHQVDAALIGDVIDWQADVVRAEIRDISPDGIVLFTGPNYDWILQRVFLGAELKALKGSSGSVRAIAQVVHPSLPRKTVRTYHPAYMQRSGQMELLDDVVRFLSD